MDNYNFMNLSLYFKNDRCDQFIIKLNNLNTLSENIKIKLKDIKLKMINDINYPELKKYSNLYKNIEVPKETNIYKFKLPEKINNLNIHNIQRKIISLKLKIKETDLVNSFAYEFYTLFNNKIKIDSFDEFSEDEFENDKFYLFNGFYYDNNILYKTNYSSIEIVDENSEIEKNIFPENINDINIGEIINIKGSIKDFLIGEMILLIEESNIHTEIKMKLNYDLIKKVNPNKECKFLNIKKIGDKYFEATIFSDIYSNWETTIELKVKDIQYKYYDRINIDNKYYININDNIHGDILKFNINTKNKSFVYIQKFILEKTKFIGNNKTDKKGNIIVENSYEFYLEVNKGRINSYPCFLNKE